MILFWRRSAAFISPMMLSLIRVVSFFHHSFFTFPSIFFSYFFLVLFCLVIRLLFLEGGLLFVVYTHLCMMKCVRVQVWFLSEKLSSEFRYGVWFPTCLSLTLNKYFISNISNIHNIYIDIDFVSMCPHEKRKKKKERKCERAKKSATAAEYARIFL